MMRLPRNPDKSITQAQARVALKMMLVNARSIDAFTPESLARMYRVPLKECEYELTIARQKREAQA